MKRIIIVFTVLLLFNIGNGVQINYIKVPQAVRNNSGHSTILDCNYAVRPDDTDLVVKWLLNGELVYQWLPPQKPQSLGPLKNRLDLEFKASGDPKTVHRALMIVNPTTDIAGEYKCFVSTFADEDFSSKTMIVFEPESSLILYKNRSDNKEINFTCFATEVYPQPKIVIYKDKKEDVHNKYILDAVEWNIRKNIDNTYSVFLTSKMPLSNLEHGSLIFCELRIPGTGYSKRKSLIYYPQEVENWSGCCNKIPSVTIVVALWSAMF